MTVVRPLARSAALIGGMTLAGLAASPAFAATNLIGNGSFEAFSAGASGKTTIAPGGEAGTIAPWTVTGDSVDLYAASKLAPQDGTQSVDLDGNAPGGVSQAVTTTAGTTYTATFYYAGNPSDTPRIKVARVNFGSTVQNISFDTSGHTTAAPGWVQGTITTTATGASTTLSFTDLDNGAGSVVSPTQSGVTLDNVVVTAGAAGTPVAALPESPLGVGALGVGALGVVRMAAIGGTLAIKRRRSA